MELFEDMNAKRLVEKHQTGYSKGGAKKGMELTYRRQMSSSSSTKNIRMDLGSGLALTPPSGGAQYETRKRWMSDMGLDMAVGEKRRRAQVFSKVEAKAINFMKQQKGSPATKSTPREGMPPLS